MSHIFSKTSKLQTNIKVLCLTSFIEGLVAVGPLWSLYIDELKGSLLILGLVLSLSSLSTSVFQIPGGLFSDRVGRKKAIIIGGLIRTISLCYIGFVPSIGLLIPGMIVSSVAGALINPAKSALVAESAHINHKGKTFGLIDTIQSFTMIIGPALGLFIAGKINIRIVFYFSAALSLFSLILSIKFLEEAEGSKTANAKRIGLKTILEEQFSWFRKNKDLNILLTSQGFAMLASSFASPFFPLFAVKELSIEKEKLALIFMASNILLMLTRIPVGHITDKPSMKKKYLLIWGCVWGAFVWILVSESRNYFHLFSFALLSLAFVLPTRSALISDMTDYKERASVFGTLAAIDGVSGAVGYAIAGAFANIYGMRLSMKTAGIGLFLSALFIWLFFKEKLNYNKFESLMRV